MSSWAVTIDRSVKHQFALNRVLCLHCRAPSRCGGWTWRISSACSSWAVTWRETCKSWISSSSMPVSWWDKPFRSFLPCRQECRPKLLGARLARDLQKLDLLILNVSVMASSTPCLSLACDWLPPRVILSKVSLDSTWLDSGRLGFQPWFIVCIESRLIEGTLTSSQMCPRSLGKVALVMRDKMQADHTQASTCFHLPVAAIFPLLVADVPAQLLEGRLRTAVGNESPGPRSPDAGAAA